MFNRTNLRLHETQVIIVSITLAIELSKMKVLVALKKLTIKYYKAFF